MPKKQTKAPENPTPRPVGRPARPWENPVYKPEHCETIQEWYKEGLSDVQCAARLGICKDTYYDWIRNKPEFARAVAAGKTLSEDWWTDIGVRGMKGEFKISEKIWSMNMKNRFKWSDVVNVADMSQNSLDRSVRELREIVELQKSREKDF